MCHYFSRGCDIPLLRECRKHFQYEYKVIFCIFKKFSTVLLEAYHCQMGRYSNMNHRSRAATENFTFLKAANNGSLKTNCCFESRARWNALAKKLACLKAGKRLLWSLACWTNFLHFHQWGLHCLVFAKKKQKLSHAQHVPITRRRLLWRFFWLFAQKRGLHLTQLIWSHFLQKYGKNVQIFS